MLAEIAQDERPRPASVLIPVLEGPQLRILLTRRAAHLRSHRGQIAFPGGKIEDDDRSPLEAALRETEEEIGLDRAFVEPIGYLDSYRTRTGFHIMPVVALVRPGFMLEIDRNEVDLTFEVPFDFLMDPSNHRRDSVTWQGRERFFYAMPYQDHYIWGATAGMIKNLYERLRQT